jgi:hypothetical protein
VQPAFGHPGDVDAGEGDDDDFLAGVGEAVDTCVDTEGADHAECGRPA